MVDEGLVLCLCIFDICKCFDCIPHEALVYKLSKYGIRGTENEWFQSYLSGRSQSTKYNNITSNPLPVTTGIPQGSVLGPSLFLLFINDLTCVIKHSAINIYADDTLIYVADENIESAAHKMQIDIDAIAEWFKNNMLTLSVEKTFTMYVGTRQRLQQISTYPELKINNQLLKIKNSAAYLGLIIDKHLTWNEHISLLCKKLRPKVGIFSRLRHILPLETMFTVYMAIIQSKLDYGLTIWGNASKVDIQTVQRVQSRCARLMTGCFDQDTSSLGILAQLGILNVTQRFQYFLGTLMFKCFNNNAPNYMCDTITRMHGLHNHNTRNEYLLRIPPSQTNYGKRSFSNAGSCLWNSLPDVVKASSTTELFKSQMRNHLFASVNHFQY